MTDERRDNPNNATGYREKVNQRKAEAENHSMPEKDSKESVSSHFVWLCMWLKELGLGMLYAAINANRFRYAKNMGEWLEWAVHFWKRDTMHNAYAACENVANRILDEREKISDQIGQAASNGDEHERERLEAIRKQYDKQVDQLRTQRGRANTLMMAHTCEGGLGISGEELDANPWPLACPSGVIDLRTGALRNGRRDDYISMSTRVPWEGNNASCPDFLKFLDSILERQEEIDFLQRWLGYCATGKTTEQKFLCLSGAGRNGKGVLIEIMNEVLGDLAGPIRSELLLDQGRAQASSGPSGDIMDLMGKRLVTASESDEGRKFSPSRVKWLTGSDTLVGRYAFDKRQTAFRPTHKLILQSNHKPHAPAEDFAFWDRLLLLDLPFQFVDEPENEYERKRDNNLLERIRQNELPGVLAWVVEGALLWQQHGLAPPNSVIQATEAYRREEDVVQDWIEERCVVFDNPEHGATSAGKLYEDFVDWWKTYQGARPRSSTWFGRRMAKKFCKEKRAGSNHYVGIGLLPK